MNKFFYVLLFSILISPFMVNNTYSQKINDGMVLIPSGEFKMGTDSNWIPDLMKLGSNVPHLNYKNALLWFGNEIPLHKVRIDSFYIDICEVTNREFMNFINETGYKAKGDWEKFATPERMNHPVVNVTWEDANTYAKWAGKRLPTEAEWEFAANANSKFKWFWWGDSSNGSEANFNFEGETLMQAGKRILGFENINTKPVKSYKPNYFGLYDMLGNVSEWCADCYSENYKSNEKKSDCNYFVIRGGNWRSPNIVFIRRQVRKGKLLNHFDYTLGFRCVADVNKNK